MELRSYLKEGDDLFMKRAWKRLLAFLGVVILTSNFFVFPAYALEYDVISLDPNMSRERCWIEAAKYDYLDLSRQRVAVELYYWSSMYQQINEATQSVYDADLIAGGMCILGYATSLGIAIFNPPAGAFTAKGVSVACGVTGLA